jgi:hypothetical protein
MKAIISIMILIVGVLVFLVVDTDITDTKALSEQSVASSNTDKSNNKETTENDDKKVAKSTDSSKLYTASSSDKKNQSGKDDYSRYESADSANYQGNDSSYNSGEQYNSDTESSYDNSQSSYNQSNSAAGNTSTVNTSNNNVERTNLETSKEKDTNNDSDTTKEKDSENLKFQRLYDNGIMWYGETGTLNIEYQSSHAETTGIGFRVHYDSSSIKPINITQYPVDAIVNTTPNTAMADADNRDNNPATDSFLPFAWASIYGQWPQTNELNVASIEFEKVTGGSNDYTVNYSAVSVPAGFQLVR